MSGPRGVSTAPDRGFDPFDHYGTDFFRAARAQTPVFFSEQLDAYVLTRYVDCRAVLTRPAEIVSARNALTPPCEPTAAAARVLDDSGFVDTPALVDEDGKGHRTHRAATQSPFLPDRLTGLDGYIRDQVHSHLDAIVHDGETDIVDTMIDDVAARVLLHMMGIADDDMDVIAHFRGPFTEVQFGQPTDAVQLQAAVGLGRLGKWARDLTQRRIDHSGQDVVSAAHRGLASLDATDRPFLDAFTLSIVMAGHNQVKNTMAGGVTSLFGDPDQYADLVRDASLIPNAVQEILRHDTGVPTWRQLVVKDLVVPSGTLIPAGSTVYVALGSANRDDSIFTDGDHFDIRRPNAADHLAFGTGAHRCMGEHLAGLELQIMIEVLTERLPHARLVPGQVWTTSRNTSQRGPEHVRLQWDPTPEPPLPEGSVPTSPA